MEKELLIIITNLVSISMMFGISWIIQIVHYPSFNFVEANKFVDFSKFHTSNISYIVVPVMLIELLTSFLILNITIENSIKYLLIISLFLLILNWISTFMVQVPLHKSLSSKKDYKLIIHLVRSNWMRTIFWSIRFIVICFVVYIFFMQIVSE